MRGRDQCVGSGTPPPAAEPRGNTLKRSKDGGTSKSGQYLALTVLCGIFALHRTVSDDLTEMCSGSEADSYLRLVHSCITQLKAHGPSRTCNESKEDREEKKS